MNLTPNLAAVIREAIDLCHSSVQPDKQLEEHGGWILSKGDEFKFFFLRNDNSGTPRANILFTANREDVGKGPLKWMIKEGWKNYGTFHTHPQFSVIPSSTDWNFLFQASPYNFIYSPATLQLGVSHYLGRDEKDEGQRWEQSYFDVVDDEFIKAVRARRATE